VATSYGRDASTTAPCEVDGFFDFSDGLRLDVEGGSRVEGSRPGGLDVVWHGAEGDVVLALCERRDDGEVHLRFEELRSC